MKKILIISLIAIMLLAVAMPIISYAEDLGLGTLDEYKGSMPDSEKAKQKAGKILGLIRTIGSILSVVILMGIGIKYMYGSVEEKSQYKETLWPWLLGAAIVFAGTWLPQVIYDFASNI